jgi:hypothetical protein
MRRCVRAHSALFSLCLQQRYALPAHAAFGPAEASQNVEAIGLTLLRLRAGDLRLNMLPQTRVLSCGAAGRMQSWQPLDRSRSRCLCELVALQCLVLPWAHAMVVANLAVAEALSTPRRGSLNGAARVELL